MTKGTARAFMVSSVLLLLSLSSFFLGFTVNEAIHSKSEPGNVATVQYRVIPGIAENSNSVKSVIFAKVEIFK